MRWTAGSTRGPSSSARASPRSTSWSARSWRHVSRRSSRRSRPCGRSVEGRERNGTLQVGSRPRRLKGRR
eukprot:5593151-Heterocapsa_arctica.AAC.1